MRDDLSFALDRLTPDDPFLLDWDDVRHRTEPIRRQRSPLRRVRGGTFIGVAIAAFIIAPLTALAVHFVSSGPSVGHPRMLSGSLLILLPQTGSAAGGSTVLQIAGRRRTVEVVLVADYQMPHSPSFSLRTVPAPPPERVAIAIRHFRATGTSARWPAVRHLLLPAQTRRDLTWRVRLSGEAVEVEVRFGSTPDAVMRASASKILRGVRHT
jgi:hypothetical protein